MADLKKPQSDRENEFASIFVGLSSQKRTLLWQLAQQYDESTDQDEKTKIFSYIKAAAFRTFKELRARNVRDFFNFTLVRPHRKYVGNEVRKCRTNLNMTQVKLSEITGIDQAHISRIEKGLFCSTYKTIAKLAKALNVKVSQLDPSYYDCGCQVKKVRLRRGMSRANLAQLVDVSAERIEDIEDGDEEVDMKLLVDLANALNVRPQEIDGSYNPSNRKN